MNNNEHESHEQMKHQADAEGNTNASSLNLDALTGNASEAWSAAANGRV